MHINRATKRPTLGLTSLIDVIFLLLLFFMLSSTFLKFSELDLNLSGPGLGITRDKPTVLIKLDTDASRLVVNGRDVPLEGLVEKLNEMAEKSAETAVISVRTGVETQRLIEVLEVARQSRLKTISVAAN